MKSHHIRKTKNWNKSSIYVYSSQEKNEESKKNPENKSHFNCSICIAKPWLIKETSRELLHCDFSLLFDFNLPQFLQWASWVLKTSAKQLQPWILHIVVSQLQFSQMRVGTQNWGQVWTRPLCEITPSQTAAEKRNRFQVVSFLYKTGISILLLKKDFSPWSKRSETFTANIRAFLWRCKVSATLVGFEGEMKKQEAGWRQLNGAPYFLLLFSHFTFCQDRITWYFVLHTDMVD